MTRAPEFKVGDLVQHRADKQRALITQVQESCVTQHNPYQLMCSRECKQGFCGFYTLSRGFGDTFSAHEKYLELADTDDTPLPREPELPPNRDTTDGKVPSPPDYDVESRRAC